MNTQLNFLSAEENERYYIENYIIPHFKEIYGDIKYKVSTIGGYGHNDIIIKTKDKIFVIEVKCRTVAQFFVNQGLMLEKYKYNKLVEVADFFKKTPTEILYISITNKDTIYIQQATKMIDFYELRKSNDIIHCNRSTCDTSRGKTDKPSFLLKTDNEFTKTIKINK